MCWTSEWCFYFQWSFDGCAERTQPRIIIIPLTASNIWQRAKKEKKKKKKAATELAPVDWKQEELLKESLIKMAGGPTENI